VGGADTKDTTGSGSAARTVGSAGAHAAASAIALTAIGPTRARRPLVEKLQDGNKMASPTAWSRRDLRCRWWEMAVRVRGSESRLH